MRKQIKTRQGKPSLPGIEAVKRFVAVARALPRAGFVIVTTPQSVALADVRKTVSMFRKLDKPILGIVENMTYFCCSHSDEKIPIFGTGGGEMLSREFEVPLLASLPIDLALRESGDCGVPLVEAQPDTPICLLFQSVAQVAETPPLSSGSRSSSFESG
jgi:ATP-binding protein involved in chromosome partitioning